MARELGIEGPRALQAYTPPRVLVVKDNAQLLAALRSSPARTIVIEDGTYVSDVATNTTPTFGFVTLGAGHQIFARRSGHARLKFGLNVRSWASGLRIRGVVFDIDDPLAGFAGPNYPDPVTWHTAAVGLWDDAQDVTIEDTKIFGNGVLNIGVWASSADGLRVQRVRIKDVRRFGLSIGAHGEHVSTPVLRPVLEDLVIDGVFDVAYEDHIATLDDPDEFGKQLHGIMLHTSSYVNRVRIRRVAASGIGLGNAYDPMIGTHLGNIDVNHVDMSAYTLGTGVYFERQQIYPMLTHFCIGPDVDRGVQVEWGHAINSNVASEHCPVNTSTVPIPSRNVRIRHGVIQTEQVGVYIGAWTRRTHLRDLHFENASWAAIGLYDNEGDGTNTTVEGSSFGSLPSGACRRTLDRFSATWSTAPTCEWAFPPPTDITIPPCGS